MKLNKKGIDLVKHFEGCYLKAYRCPAGVLTIGYGHTSGVTEGMEVTKAEAETMLMNDLNKVANIIEKFLPKTLNDNQFSALVSFAFNCGCNALKESTALKRLINGDINGAAEALTWWNKATVNGKKVVLKGLVRRREAEKELFLTFEKNPNQDIIDMLHKCIKMLEG